jgi:hypothetical protein
LWSKERLSLEPIRVVQMSRRSFTLFRRVLRRGYRAFLRRSAGQDGARKNTSYLRALRADQPFSNFLPFGPAAILAAWCCDPSNSGDTDPF